MDNLPRLNKNAVKVTSLDDIEEEKRYWMSKASLERMELWTKIIMAKIELHGDCQRFFEIAELL